MDVFSEYIDNDMSYEDYASITILVAANNNEEASKWIADNIEKKADPFGDEYFVRDIAVYKEPNLQTDLIEVGLITYY